MADRCTGASSLTSHDPEARPTGLGEATSGVDTRNILRFQGVVRPAAGAARTMREPAAAPKVADRAGGAGTMKRRLWIPLVLAAIWAMVMATSGAIAGTDVAPGQTGFEPNNAVVNPRNPSQVAVARGCQVRISNDYGQTWPIIRNTSLASCQGDPSMAYDSQSRLFMSHLSTIGGELAVVAGQIADTTTTGTLTYTPIQVSTTDGLGDDKQWLAVDANPTSPFRDNLYLVWSRNPTIPCNFPGCSVLFSRSTNQGGAWSAQQVISANGEGFVWPAHVAVAQNGDVYVAYHTATCGAANGAHPADPGRQRRSEPRRWHGAEQNAFAGGQATVSCNVQDGSGDEIAGSQSWMQGSKCLGSCRIQPTPVTSSLSLTMIRTTRTATATTPTSSSPDRATSG